MYSWSKRRFDAGTALSAFTLLLWAPWCPFVGLGVAWGAHPRVEDQSREPHSGGCCDGEQALPPGVSIDEGTMRGGIVGMGSSKSLILKNMPGLRCQAYLETALEKVAEVEVPLSPALFKLVTTTDGTLRPLFSSQQGRGAAAVDLPVWLWDIAYAHGYRDPKHILWSDLSYGEQTQIFIEVAKRHLRNHGSLKIPGFRFKKEVVLSFEEETAFFGYRYGPGRHRVDLSRFLEPSVEVADPDPSRVRRLEPHFRFLASVRSLSTSVRAFLKAAGLPQRPWQIHQPQFLPTSFQNPKVYKSRSRGQILHSESRLSRILWGLRVGLLWLQLDRTAQMVDIMEEGGRGRVAVKDFFWEDGRHFVSFSPISLESIQRWMRHVKAFEVYDEVSRKRKSRGRAALAAFAASPYALGTGAKMGWVGLRGYDFYTTPFMWGLEFRFPRHQWDPELLGDLLVAMEREVKEFDLTGAWGKRLWDYLNGTVRSDSFTYILAIHSHIWVGISGEWVRNFAKMTGHRTEDISVEVKYRQQLSEEFPEHLELQMLTHSWGSHLEFFDRPDLVGSIQASQRQVLSEFLEVRDEKVDRLPEGGWWESKVNPKFQRIMRKFLCTSGLYYFYLQQLALGRYAQKRCQELGYEIPTAFFGNEAIQSR